MQSGAAVLKRLEAIERDKKLEFELAEEQAALAAALYRALQVAAAATSPFVAEQKRRDVHTLGSSLRAIVPGALRPGTYLAELLALAEDLGAPGGKEQDAERALAELMDGFGELSARWYGIRSSLADASWDDFSFAKGNSRWASSASANVGALAGRRWADPGAVIAAAEDAVAGTGSDADYDFPSSAISGAQTVLRRVSERFRVGLDSRALAHLQRDNLSKGRPRRPELVSWRGLREWPGEQPRAIALPSPVYAAQLFDLGGGAIGIWREQQTLLAIDLFSGLRLFETDGLPCLLAGEQLLWLDANGALRCRDPKGGFEKPERVMLPPRAAEIRPFAVGTTALGWLEQSAASLDPWREAPIERELVLCSRSTGACIGRQLFVSDTMECLATESCLVVALDEHRDLVVVEPDGAMRWRRKDSTGRLVGEADGRLFLKEAHSISVLSAADGRTVASLKHHEPPPVTMFPTRDALLFQSGGELRAFERQSLEPAWWRSFERHTEIAASADAVLCLETDAPESSVSAIARAHVLTAQALDPATGRVLWARDIEAYRARPGALLVAQRLVLLSEDRTRLLVYGD
jgi:hypothetical protein